MRWIYIPSDEEEGYKILTAETVVKSDDGDEQQWIAIVFELEDVIEIVESHNRQEGK